MDGSAGFKHPTLGASSERSQFPFVPEVDSYSAHV